MLVSINWLKDNLSNSNIVILDTRPKTMFLYGHIPNSQSLTIDQIVEFDQYGSNLVPDEKKITELFSSLGIDDSKTVVIVGDSMDPRRESTARRRFYFE